MSHHKYLIRRTSLVPDKYAACECAANFNRVSVFTSSEFADFMANKGISHVKVAPYHPSSNGLAERALQIFKRNIERQTTGTLKTKLARFLFNYRTTPHSTTTTPPAQLLMRQKLKTRTASGFTKGSREQCSETERLT